MAEYSHNNKDIGVILNEITETNKEREMTMIIINDKPLQQGEIVRFSIQDLRAILKQLESEYRITDTPQIETLYAHSFLTSKIETTDLISTPDRAFAKSDKYFLEDIGEFGEVHWSLISPSECYLDSSWDINLFDYADFLNNEDGTKLSLAQLSESKRMQILEQEMDRNIQTRLDYVEGTTLLRKEPSMSGTNLKINYLISYDPTPECLVSGLYRISSYGDTVSLKVHVTVSQVAKPLYKEPLDQTFVKDLTHESMELDQKCYPPAFGELKPKLNYRGGLLSSPANREATPDLYEEISPYLLSPQSTQIHIWGQSEIEEEEATELIFEGQQPYLRFLAIRFTRSELLRYSKRIGQYYEPTPKWFEGKMVICHKDSVTDTNIFTMKDVVKAEVSGKCVTVLFQTPKTPINIRAELAASFINAGISNNFSDKNKGPYDFRPLL